MCLGPLETQGSEFPFFLFCLSFVCVHGEDSLGLYMEDLRSVEREGPSPSEACQIRRGGKKKRNKPLLGLIRTSKNTEHFVVYACLCLCVHVLIKQRSSVGLCGFKLFSSSQFVL